MSVKRGLLMWTFVLVSMVACRAALIVNEPFDGSTLGEDWSATLTPAATAVVSDGKVTLNIGATSNQYRAYLRMQKPEFNYYNNSLSVAARGMELRGVAPDASNAAWFFFGISDDVNLNGLHPLGAANGQFFAFKRIKSGINQITQLFALQRKDGVLSGHSAALANFSTAVIGGVDIAIDGNEWSITVRNPGDAVLGSASYSTTFSGVESNFSAFNFVMGTYNSITPTEGGSMDIGTIQITAIPEPATLGLFVVSSVGLFVSRKYLSNR